MKKSKLLIMNVIVAIMLLSSCSVTKMRYTRGLNVEFLKRNDKNVTIVNNHAKVAVKKTSTIVNKVDTTEFVAIKNNSDIHVNSKITVPEANNLFLSSSSFNYNKNTNKVDKKMAPSNISIKPKKDNLKIVEQPIQYSDEKKSGVWGIFGFIFTLIAFQPVGLIFCIIGMSRNRKCRGLAIAGFIISILVIIAILATL